MSDARINWDKYLSDIRTACSDLQAVDDLLDELDRKNGDAPHRAVNRLGRIRVLAGHNELTELFHEGGNFSGLLDRMAMDALRKYKCNPADLVIVESRKITKAPVGTHEFHERRWTIERKQL